MRLRSPPTGYDDVDANCRTYSRLNTWTPAKQACAAPLNRHEDVDKARGVSVRCVHDEESRVRAA